MFKLIKRFFGLDYNDHKPVETAPIGDVFTYVPEASVEVKEEVVAVPVEAAPVKEKKPRKPAAKKAAPKAAAKKPAKKK